MELTDKDLLRRYSGEMKEEEEQRTDEHIKNCASCRARANIFRFAFCSRRPRRTPTPTVIAPIEMTIVA